MNNQLNYCIDRLNLRNTSISRIEHRDAFVAPVYLVSLPDGTQQILKLCVRHNHYQCEIYYLKYFSNKIPVPKIIDVIQPDEYTHGAILMEFISGSLLTNSDFNDGVAYDIGSTLAHIHENRTNGFGDLTQFIGKITAI